MKKELPLTYDLLPDDSKLNSEDRNLLQQARNATANAYAPYSNFFVGAVALLNNGETVAGTNQENASYPVGICAERVLISAASSIHPGIPIKTLAISYKNNNIGHSNKPISPCGICRQSLAEYEERMQQPMKLILAGQSGPVIILENASLLLPFSFGGSDLG